MYETSRNIRRRHGRNNDGKSPESPVGKNDWKISIVDERKEHHYQPGYLFLPFDIYSPSDIIKSIDEFIPKMLS